MTDRPPDGPPRSRSLPPLLRVLVASLISGGLLYYLVKLGGVSALGEALRPRRPSLLVLSLLPYAAAYAMRVLRFRLLNAQGPVRSLWGVVCLHNLLNRVLPLKLGEISYPVLANRAGLSPAGTAAGDLLVARALDLLVVVGLFLLSGAALAASAPHGSPLVLLLAFALAAAAGLFLFFRETVFRWMLTGLGRGVRRLGRPGAWLAERLLSPDAPALVAGRIVGPARWVALLVVTVAVWASLYTCFFLVLAAYGVSVGLGQLIVGATGAAIVGVVPVGGVGTIGIQETGWALAFVAAGVGRGEAVTTGVSAQVVTLLFAAALAASAYAVRKRG